MQTNGCACARVWPQRMSGIATATAAMVASLDGLRTRVLETRKTAPGALSQPLAQEGCGMRTQHALLVWRRRSCERGSWACARCGHAGLRLTDKWAVLIGGGSNHRMGLFDMMMIKDNHIAAAGGISAAVQRAEEYIR